MSWSYDAIERRSWTYGDSAVTLCRTLELGWTEFDSNPAAFATFVRGRQAIEEFLSSGPLVATPPEIVAEIRTAIEGARVPGSSTLVEVAVEASVRTGEVSLLVDGRDESVLSIVGPPSAGVYGDSTPLPRRVLAAPGRHAIAAHVQVWRSREDGMIESSTLVAARDVELVRGQALVLRCIVDAHGARLVS
jgi:hypothetical protein